MHLTNGFQCTSDHSKCLRYTETHLHSPHQKTFPIPGLGLSVSLERRCTHGLNFNQLTRNKCKIFPRAPTYLKATCTNSYHIPFKTQVQLSLSHQPLRHRKAWIKEKKWNMFKSIVFLNKVLPRLGNIANHKGIFESNWLLHLQNAPFTPRQMLEVCFSILLRGQYLFSNQFNTAFMLLQSSAVKSMCLPCRVDCRPAP